MFIKGTLARTRSKRPDCIRSGINSCRDESALFAAQRQLYLTVGISRARFREAVSPFLSCSISLSQDRLHGILYDDSFRRTTALLHA